MVQLIVTLAVYRFADTLDALMSDIRSCLVPLQKCM
jgi:hypothetical protein